VKGPNERKSIKNSDNITMLKARINIFYFFPYISKKITQNPKP
jgi:hypothetical protein